MAFSIKIIGEDVLDALEKSAFERHLVEEVHHLVNRLKVRPGVNVTDGSVSVDTLDDVSFKAEDAPVVADDNG